MCLSHITDTWNNVFWFVAHIPIPESFFWSSSHINSIPTLAGALEFEWGTSSHKATAYCGELPEINLHTFISYGYPPPPAISAFSLMRYMMELCARNVCFCSPFLLVIVHLFVSWHSEMWFLFSDTISRKQVFMEGSSGSSCNKVELWNVWDISVLTKLMVKSSNNLSVMWALIFFSKKGNHRNPPPPILPSKLLLNH